MRTTVECQRNSLTAAHIVNSTATFTVISTMTISLPPTHAFHSLFTLCSPSFTLLHHLCASRASEKGRHVAEAEQVTVFSSQTLPLVCTCVVSFYSTTFSRPAATHPAFKYIVTAAAPYPTANRDPADALSRTPHPLEAHSLHSLRTRESVLQRHRSAAGCCTGGRTREEQLAPKPRVPARNVAFSLSTLMGVLSD